MCQNPQSVRVRFDTWSNNVLKVDGDAGLKEIMDKFYITAMSEVNLRPYLEDGDVETLSQNQHVYIKSLFTNRVNLKKDSLEIAPDTAETELEKSLCIEHLQKVLQNMEVPEGIITDILNRLKAHKFNFVSAKLTTSETFAASETTVRVRAQPSFESAEEATVHLFPKASIKVRLETWSKEAFSTDLDTTLESIIDQFQPTVLVDPILKRFFVGHPNLRQHLSCFLKVAMTEGKFRCKNALDMAHGEQFALGLGGEEYDHYLEHLIKALKTFNVPTDVVDDMVAIVTPVRSIFVEGKIRHFGTCAIDFSTLLS